MDSPISNYIQRNETKYNSFHCASKFEGLRLNTIIAQSLLGFERLSSDLACDKYSKLDATKIYTIFINKQLDHLRECFRAPVAVTPINLTSEIISKYELLRKCELALNNVFHLAAKDFEIKILHDTVPIPEIDKQTINEIEKNTLIKWQLPRLECSIYSFYHLRFPHAVDYIVGKITLEQYTEFQEKHGIPYTNFKLVDDPQEGDLIHYLDENMRPIHFGVLKDSCTVISKWGDLPPIFEHLIHKCPYGVSYAILREEKDITAGFSSS